MIGDSVVACDRYEDYGYQSRKLDAVSTFQELQDDGVFTQAVAFQNKSQALRGAINRRV